MLLRRRDDNLESYASSLISSSLSGDQHNYHRLLADPKTPIIKVDNLNNNLHTGYSKSVKCIKDVIKPNPVKYFTEYLTKDALRPIPVRNLTFNEQTSNCKIAEIN